MRSKKKLRGYYNSPIKMKISVITLCSSTTIPDRSIKQYIKCSVSKKLLCLCGEITLLIDFKKYLSSYLFKAESSSTFKNKDDHQSLF